MLFFESAIKNNSQLLDPVQFPISGSSPEKKTNVYISISVNGAECNASTQHVFRVKGSRKSITGRGEGGFIKEEIIKADPEIPPEILRLMRDIKKIKNKKICGCVYT